MRFHPDEAACCPRENYHELEAGPGFLSVDAGHARFRSWLTDRSGSEPLFGRIVAARVLKEIGHMPQFDCSSLALDFGTLAHGKLSFASSEGWA
jgi:hypothetical protein